MANIVLIGFMGTGKTTVSNQLSQMYGMELVDMDQVISDREEMTIPEIFSCFGEAYFRTLETKLLIELQAKQNIIISCGGGTAIRDENVREMKKNGKVFLLTATPETIYERVKDSDDRPMLKGRNNVNGISELLEMRRPKYEAAADIVIETDHKSVQEICREIINKNKGD